MDPQAQLAIRILITLCEEDPEAEMPLPEMAASLQSSVMDVLQMCIRLHNLGSVTLRVHSPAMVRLAKDPDTIDVAEVAEACSG